jgi:hypothetical protein
MINWGKVPTKGQLKKQQEFTNPVMIFAAVEKKGGGRKITFNKAAQEALSIVGEDSILLGYSDDKNHLYVCKTAEGTEGSLKLTKTCSFSNKRWFESIVKANSLDITQKNVFNITSVDGTVFEATLRGTESDAATPVDSAPLVNEENTQTVITESEVVEAASPSEEGTDTGWED